MEKNFEFRTLRADEIDVRVGSKGKDGAFFLLYKDARCDMAILDEKLTPFGWQREHKQLKDVIYCGVSIKDPETGTWITKWDAGSESNTEAEKGEASDSFKRACVNWGIGRELYTAPRIWITCNPDEFKFDKLRVSDIKYNDKREITALTLVDKTDTVRYTHPFKGKAASKVVTPKPAPAPAPAAPVLTGPQIAKKFMADNVKAFEYYQRQYPHRSTIDEFSVQELTEIYNHLKSNNKIA